ncbi:hypothetical protein LDENG_00214120 [Lucifuga dentata]|nr:hypothetical protein LDENG_00214120 [Lucifuga dentata]
MQPSDLESDTLPLRHKPVPPCVSLRESVQVYREHCRMAREFHQVKHEIAVLEDRKRKLLAELVEDEKVAMEIARLEEEFRRLTEENRTLVTNLRPPDLQLTPAKLNVTRSDTRLRQFQDYKMSLLTMSAPRSSVFTFESTVHSCHVLRCLDEQRRRDVLCDVTVVVEGQSFRAHRSVLASCSEYFTLKISSHTQHGAVISLPQEVTVAGFEPLLKFAYTSKLLFSKDNVLDIRDSASVLGFRDLDRACFDFLLPKFFSSSKSSAPFQRKTCCKDKFQKQLSKKDCDTDDKLLSEKEVKPIADSPSQQEVAWLSHKSANCKMGSKSSIDAITTTTDKLPEGPNDGFMQCPKYRKFLLACGKETCGTEKNLDSSVTVMDSCNFSCLPFSSRGNAKAEVESPALSSNPNAPCQTESDDLKIKKDVGREDDDRVKRDKDAREGKWDEKERDNMKMEEEMEYSTEVTVKKVSSGPITVLGERSSGLILHHCPLKACCEGSETLEQEKFALDVTEDKQIRDSLGPVSIHERQAEEDSKRIDAENDSGWQERGSMERAEVHGETEQSSRDRRKDEREVAEHLVKRLGLDTSSSPLTFQDPAAGFSFDSECKQLQRSSLDWLKLHVNFNSTSNSCPFLEDLDQSKRGWKGAHEAKMSECEGASQAGKSPGVSSFNSGEDGDSETETEGDSESYAREIARQVQLPFTVDWIVNLSRNDFQQLLKQKSFTREQLDFVHDVRRRSKNRIAAQRCRKRKLDCIYNLQCEINKLKTEREKLMTERNQLNQLKMKTCHNVSALCQRVCTEAHLQPEQLQVLAKYSSPECPLASFSPHINSLLTQPAVPLQPQASLSACFPRLDQRSIPVEVFSSSSRDTVTGDGPHSGDRPAP